ncbi:MAG: hypothetical protein V5A16_00145 [Haloplanus sp.]
MTHPSSGTGVGRRTEDDRGQFVLLAGVVVALALVAMLTAYLQLGYAVDVRTTDTDRTTIDGRAFLERATHGAARPLRGEYIWGERGQAVTAFHDRLDLRLVELERSRVGEGVVYRTEYNQTTAAQWARAECPGGGPGSDRAFGPCEADRGVVVQERAGRTLVLAVAYDLTVTTEDTRTESTFVANASG